MLRFFLVVLLAKVTVGFADPVVVRDLRPQWLVYQDSAYQSWDDTRVSVSSIHFRVDGQLYNGQYLSVAGVDDWTLFINGKLIFEGRRKALSIDSLRSLYSRDLFCTVRTPSGVFHLQTKVIAPVSLADNPLNSLAPRPPSFFLNFSVLASAIIIIFLLLLFRTNPQLTLDYFSFAKVFSVRERNENLLASRITSSVNLLFYLFCALLTGLLLTTVFYIAGPYFTVSDDIVITSLGQAFGIWALLSLAILLLLALKLVIVSLFSALFNFRETVSFQFFNFLRFVLFTAVMMALLSLVYFIFKGNNPLFYQRIMIAALMLMSVGPVMVLVKLLARAPFSLFHLFSYLCASEIIPLVVIIKVFF
ncbi:MAG: DUF4271 domain-containing protein [Cyclobacteriaceae bacterium]|nr:DUF4271 domain-containing protein [Cyclobacteriaceae bacterium]